MEKENLYFVAIIPPEPIKSEVLQIKKYFEEHHKSKAALKSPPHITLHMPFKWKTRKEPELIEKLASFNFPQSNFNISLLNFDCFEPRVIFIDVAKNQMLHDLQKQLIRHMKVTMGLLNANYKERPFHPHMTVAFRDLRKAEFLKAWETFKTKKFSATFDCASCVLLKHDGNQWQEHVTFSFD